MNIVNNTIENNYIEFKEGNITNIASIYLYGGGTEIFPLRSIIRLLEIQS